MDDKLGLAAVGLGFMGWFCAVLTRFLSMWTVSGSVNNNTDTVALHWDGVWIHWEQQGDGSLHCHFIQSVLHLSGSFRSWRALITASICIGFVANVLYVVGRLKFPRRMQVKVVSGVLFVVSGLLLLVVASWVSHRSSKPLDSVIPLKRELGAALYTGWIGTVLLVVGGGTLVSACCLSPPPEIYRTPVSRSAPEAVDPLNTIHSATFRQDDSPYYPTTRPF
ncbi:claudin-3-like [Alosa sapidissima]|uniref:claudin-3-like n=1 Tax=Alosa sapidissima TaxID=34773 RepID=UPI001C09B3EF|nr:claudin-3-like [Alosa sapidissima]